MPNAAQPTTAAAPATAARPTTTRSWGPETLVANLLMVASLACTADAGGPGTAGASSAWTIDSVPRLEVGGHADEPEYLLDGVAGATLLGDGRLVILDRGSAELRFPFRLVRLPGDSLMVLGARSGLTWFGPDGRYIRSRRVDLFALGDDPCRLGEGTVAGLPDGSVIVLLEDNFAPAYCPPQPTGVWRMTGLVGRQGWEPSPRFDTLAVMPATERNGDDYRVFGRSLLLAVARDRVYAGDTGSEVLLALDFEGDTVARLPSPFPPPPLPDAARSRGARQWERPDGTIVYGEAYDYPDSYPRYAQLLVDSGGNLWVKAFPPVLEPVNAPTLAFSFGGFVAEGGAEWSVSSPAGEVVQRIRTPPGLFVTEIGEDYVLGISRDELGVETVLVYDLDRS